MNRKQTHSIGTVARITGVPKSKLRDWCNRYLVHIERIQVGNCSHRRFTDEDVQAIGEIKRLIGEGSTLRSAAEKALAGIRKENVKDEI
jgi:DNA-binding transcriptional MerR regulator